MITLRLVHRLQLRAVCLVWGVVSGLTLLLTGCTSTPITTTETRAASQTSPAAQSERRHWMGKLSVRIGHEPVQYFSAGFELQGDDKTGEMQLFSPLGNTVATLRWQADGGAQWQHGEQWRHYASMAELSADLTGTALPLNTLFDWLHGRPSSIEGWQADLSQHANGKLQAQRLYPTPSTQLRLVFEP